MLAWIAPLIVLGLVVFVHELGHFIAAKLVGVYAPRFSLGWGTPLVRWRRHGSETEYVISALPIGGYVRMASREDETASMLEGGNEKVEAGAERGKHWDPEAMLPHGPRPVPANRWFESKHTWQRVFVLLAGVTMNAALTIGVSTGIFAVYGRAYVPAVVDSVVAGKPAQLAGLQKGDSIVALNGAPVRMWNDVLTGVSGSAGRPLRIDVQRGTERLTISVTPEERSAADPVTGKLERVGRIGAGPAGKLAREPIPLGESVASGWRATWAMAGSVVGVLGGLVRGTVSVSTLGGPIAIARTSVAAAKTGMEPLLTLIAFLSINLAVLNLLPIPILDGGQILMTLAEAVKGSAFSDRTRENLMRVGLAAIALLFVVVMFNDIKGLVLSVVS
jgi:regulator of sigma E protease